MPIFLFASGYLTALSGRVPLGKRLKAALIPYAIAFVAAYIYMTLHNPAMDHRVTTTLARFGLAYVFVYYYVFVYVGCSAVMWLILRISHNGAEEPERRLGLFLILAIGVGLIAGSYLDPALSRLGLSDALIEEVRMRDIPFWFSFMAAGALTAMSAGFIERSMRTAVCRRVADCVRDLCGRPHFRYRRRRGVRFDRLLRLCRVALLLAVHGAAAIAMARRDRLGQLLHLPLAHLHRHAAARSRRVASIRRYRGLCDYIWRDRPRSVSSPCWPFGRLPLPVPYAGWGPKSMLLRHTLLYLPAQFVGPLFQLVAMIVWTHVVDEHTLGIITLVTATHELLQIGFLAWWSQYALRFFGRYQHGNEAVRFYRTENSVLLISVVLQSVAMIGILLLIIAPDATTGLLVATVGYVITRSLNLYIGERARSRHQISVYSIQQMFGPAVGFHRWPGLDQAARSIARMAAGWLRGRATGRDAHRSAEDRLWPQLLADRSRDRRHMPCGTAFR